MKTMRITSMALALAVALPMMAQAQTPNMSGQNSQARLMMKKMTNKPLDAACMQTAVGKRDNAIETGVDAYASAVKSALEARRDALNAAWGNTDLKARRTAIQAIWKSYGSAAKSARMTFKKVRNDSWDQFRKDRAMCGPGAAAMDSATGAADGLL